MMARISTLIGYLWQRTVFSLAGAAYVALTIAFYLFAFRTLTPERAYFVLVIGLFGGLATFFCTLTAAARANEASSYPFFVRLESRIEYLIAVMLTGISFAFLLQVLIAMAAYFRNGPMITAAQLGDALPMWISVNIAFTVMALHATDFVSRGWSRVTVFGTLAVVIFLGDSYGALARWLEQQFNGLGNTFARGGSQENAQLWYSVAGWFGEETSATISDLFGIVFWPFEALIAAEIRGFFSRAEAFAPAVLILYATLLFLFASEFFATKDLALTEE